LGELNFTKPVNANAGDRYGSRGGTHKGIDYPAHKGASVVASEDGLVLRAADNPGTESGKRAYGNVIVIYHNPGEPDAGKKKDKHIYTLYAHLDKMYVKAGDFVEKHEMIGAAGSTGTSTGPHLHFEVIESKGAMGVGGGGGIRKNPEDYFNQPTEAEGTLPDIVERAVMDRIEFVPDIDLKRGDPFRLRACLDGKDLGYVNKYRDTLKADVKYDLKEELKRLKALRNPPGASKSGPARIEYRMKIL